MRVSTACHVWVVLAPWWLWTLEEVKGEGIVVTGSAGGSLGAFSPLSPLLQLMLSPRTPTAQTS